MTPFVSLIIYIYLLFHNDNLTYVLVLEGWTVVTRDLLCRNQGSAMLMFLLLHLFLLQYIEREHTMLPTTILQK